MHGEKLDVKQLLKHRALSLYFLFLSLGECLWIVVWVEAGAEERKFSTMYSLLLLLKGEDCRDLATGSSISEPISPILRILGD